MATQVTGCKNIIVIFTALLRLPFVLFKKKVVYEDLVFLDNLIKPLRILRCAS